MCFDPCNHALSFRKSRRTPKSHFRECERRRHNSLKVGLRQICASTSQFLQIITSLSRFSMSRQHCHKLMSTFAMEKIRSISICESRMPKIYRAKSPIFGNLDSLIDHHIKGSRPSTSSTFNLRNKDNSTLRRFSVVSCVEAIDSNNIIEIKGSWSDGRIEFAT